MNVSSEPGTTLPSHESCFLLVFSKITMFQVKSGKTDQFSALVKSDKFAGLVKSAKTDQFSALVKSGKTDQFSGLVKADKFAALVKSGKTD
jgi:hypothetical protein